MVKALTLTPASRLLLVDLASASHSREDLAIQARLLASAIPAELANPAFANQTQIQPQSMLSLLPWYCDEKMHVNLEAAARPGEVERLVASGILDLHSLLATGPGPDLFVSDPLGLRVHLFRRMAQAASQTAFAQTDLLAGMPAITDSNGREHLLLVLRPVNSIHDVDAASRLVSCLNTAKQAMPAGIEVTMSGGLLHTAANTETIRADIARIVIWSMLGFGLVYLFCLRSLAAVWLLLVPCMAVSLALGLMALTFASLSGLALGFGASMLGLAEDYATHSHFALCSGNDPEKTLASLGKPLTQGLLVNLSGFTVLLLSGLPAVRQLSVFAILSLIAGFVLAIMILPLLPWFGKSRQKLRQQSMLPQKPRPWLVTALSGLLLFLCLCFLHYSRIDLSPKAMGADMDRLMADAKKIENIWGKSSHAFFLVQGRDNDEAVARGRLLEQAIFGNEDDSQSMTSIWPTSAEREANLARWLDFAAKNGKALVQRLEKAGLENGLVANAFAPFSGLLSGHIPDFSADNLRKAGLGEIVDALLPEPGNLLLQLRSAPGEKTGQAGLEDKAGTALQVPEFMQAWTIAITPEKSASILIDQFEKEKRLVPLAWLVCVLLLLCFFRSPVLAMLAAIPPLCSLACILAFMTAAGHSLSLASLAAMPLVLGLATDHGIVISHELLSGNRLGASRAVIVSSLTTLLGMGLLALANHPALKAVGQVVFWGLLLEVPVATWLLPALCRPQTANGQAPAEDRFTESESYPKNRT